MSSGFIHNETLTLLLCLLALTEPAAGYAPFQPKSSTQTRELDVDSSSEEHTGTRSPSPPHHSTGILSSTSSPAPQHTTVNSQDSKTSIVAKINQGGGVQQCLERATAAVPITQRQRPDINVGADPTPPALPPKTRKPKLLEVPKVSEHSERGDSDMDEEASSSQEKQKVKKVWSVFGFGF